MPTYRIYRERADGHLAGPPAVVECNSDQEVIDRAKSMLEDLALEIWDGDRKVTRLEPNPVGRVQSEAGRSLGHP
jgi:hypothetical protein